MKQEQWCVRVPVTEGEPTRRQLISDGILDISLRPARDGTDLLFPVTDPARATERWECVALPKAVPLPRHDLVGGIAIMQDDDPKEAEILLASRPSIHTVLYAETPVSGEYRTRKFRVLAGEQVTVTECTEYGMRLKVDLEAAYFSARLANERQRIVSLMEEGERVCDMFAGVGPFAVALAEKAAIVIAGDINPGAVLLMEENVRINHRHNVIPMLADALHLGDILAGDSFDRIIMNLPMSPVPFFATAVRLVRPGGTIHLYAMQEREGEYREMIEKYPCTIAEERQVRSYSPTQHHAVYDITRTG
ncbi:class I SAM-dependent methyltransferase [Methanogenium organophilum]|uniref:Class I SAM-dependent methyltransferase family protein n=1 Tax=Methanogenium organophilum TaxID=2199 RepID=A0A9X9S2P2_METOG|nr:class I SAM-dependent methyltransferase family protein [Methanogenium organophilum]WAI00412.1 class I SAM-dependent methyltransferase family protein [Methanogenium organophilum]